MAGPLAGADGDPAAPTINIKKMSTVGPLGGAGVVDPRLPTINVKNVDSGHPGPRRGGGVRSPSGIQEVCCKAA
jgi:hypothetical protein